MHINLKEVIYDFNGTKFIFTKVYFILSIRFMYNPEIYKHNRTGDSKWLKEEISMK